MLLLRRNVSRDRVTRASSELRERPRIRRRRRLAEGSGAPSGKRVVARSLTLALIVGAIALPAQSSAVDVDGYVKNFFIVQQIPQYKTLSGEPQAPDGATLVADNLRARVNVSAAPTDWMSAAFSYDFVPRIQDDDNARLNEFIETGTSSTYRAYDLDEFLYPEKPDASDNFVIFQNLDRAHVSFAAPRFDFTLGRQAVAFGAARSVNPTDVIAPFLYTALDTEDRIGVDAARLRIPLGSLSELDLGYIAGDEFKEANSAFYARGRANFLNTDIVLMAMQFRLAYLAGIDISRGIGSVGFWLEAALVRNDDDVRARDTSALEHLLTFTGSSASASQFDHRYYGRVSTGVDYSLSGGTYLFLEYHYNGPGSADAADYRYQVVTPAYTDGQVYLLGRHYVIPGITWPATPLLSVSGSILWNLSDNSTLVSPGLEYNWFENVYVSAAAFIGVGPSPTYDPVPGAPPIAGQGLILDPLSTIFASEFGTYPDTYYFSIRYYF